MLKVFVFFFENYPRTSSVFGTRTSIMNNNLIIFISKTTRNYSVSTRYAVTNPIIPGSCSLYYTRIGGTFVSTAGDPEMNPRLVDNTSMAGVTDG